jgi:hypothetical protein
MLKYKIFIVITFVLLFSCQTSETDHFPVQVSEKDARHIVSLYIGNHAWDINPDVERNKIKDRVLYYNMTIIGMDMDESENDEEIWYVNSLTGDIYNESLDKIEQKASILLKQDLQQTDS